jgi:hypothetical protein
LLHDILAWRHPAVFASMLKAPELKSINAAMACTVGYEVKQLTNLFPEKCLFPFHHSS